MSCSAFRTDVANRQCPRRSGGGTGWYASGEYLAVRDDLFSSEKAVVTRWSPAVKIASQLQEQFSYTVELNTKNGAGEAIRTPDPNLGKVVLYP